MKIDDTIISILRDIEKLKEPPETVSISVLDTIIVPANESVSVIDTLSTPVDSDKVGIFGTSTFGFCEFGGD